MVNDSNSVENTTSDGTGQDITGEIEVNPEEVKLFSIEELVPSSTPLTIPYLEIYRTNELEYVPYISPYNVGIQSSSSDSESDSGSDLGNDNNSSDNNGEGNNDGSQNSSSSNNSGNNSN